MKKSPFAISVLALLTAFIACTPENNKGDDEKFSDMAVDLGIVITREDGTTYKLFWAKSNLCESGLCANPEDFGDYYAWGETKPKSEFSWSTYKWYNDYTESITKYNTNSKYGNVDNKTVLDLADDAARATLGGKWRMPNESEWSALMSQCTWEWSSQNGVSGEKVTGSNGNSIFLPAAGCRLVSILYEAGSVGYYWSSSLDLTLQRNARYVSFYSDDVYDYCDHRYYGFSVRPVTEL